VDTDRGRRKRQLFRASAEPAQDVVAFVDATLDPYATGYVVASDLPRFLVALLKSEVEHDGQ
jgi:hypothetical protein